MTAMVKMTDIYGRAFYIAAASIAKIMTPGPASARHGIGAIVKTADGSTHEIQETPQQIVMRMVETRE